MLIIYSSYYKNYCKYISILKYYKHRNETSWIYYNPRFIRDGISYAKYKTTGSRLKSNEV